MFRSVNEIDRFSFEDCELGCIEKTDDGLILNVSALIVKANNSQNTNFTDSYAADTVIRLENAVVTNILKCGYRYYNADGVLINSVPDIEMPKPEWGSLIKSFSGSYLAAFDFEEGGYVLEIEKLEEDGSQGYTYLLKICTDNIVVTWDKYLNRVQR